MCLDLVLCTLCLVLALVFPVAGLVLLIADDRPVLRAHRR